MAKINTQYEELLQDILENGSHKGDRTGTGTTSAFGAQIRYDLSEGFPLITTKKVFLRGIAEELFWFLRGSINSHELEDIKVNIWKDWADENGELGPVYGYVWRYAPTDIHTKIIEVDVKTDDYADYVKTSDEKPSYSGVGYYGGDVSQVPNVVYEYWQKMLAFCYDPSSSGYLDYGAVGYTVSPYWHSLSNFAKSLHQLPLYPMWKENLGLSKFYLDPAYFGSQVFSPTTTLFLPAPIIVTDDGSAVEYEGKLYANNQALQATLDQTLPFEKASIANLNVQGEKKLPPEGKLYRPQVYVDQIEWLINELKTNPDSRRLILTAWNPALTDYQALPPCHTFAQFYVNDGKLSCQLYQRSGDTFLGVPFNIASYALFTHMLAQQTDLEVGDFIHTFGDAHIYDNHIDQVKEQLSREARPFPTLNLKKAKSIYDYKFEDIEIVGYDPHPPIKAPVAV